MTVKRELGVHVLGCTNRSAYAQQMVGDQLQKTHSAPNRTHASGGRWEKSSWAPGPRDPGTCLLSMKDGQCNTRHGIVRYGMACGVGCNPGELQIVMLSERVHAAIGKSTWKRDYSTGRKF